MATLSISVLAQQNLPEGAIARLGKGSIERIAYSPVGTKLAVVVTTGSYSNIWLYDTQTYQVISLLTFEDSKLSSVAFSPDDTTFACAGDQDVYLWDATTGELLHHLEQYDRIVSFSPDSTTLILTGGYDNVASYFDVTTGEHIHKIEDRGLFSPDGTMLANECADGAICVWNITTGERLRTIERDNDSWLGAMAFSPDGTMLAVSGKREESDIRVWDVETGEHLTLEGSKWHRNWNPRDRFVLFSPDGTILASECEDELRLWNARTGETLLTIEDERYDSVVAFSPDGTTFIVTDWDGDSDIRLWDVATGEHLTLEYERWNEPTDVLFSPDSTTLAVVSEGDFRLWNARTGETLLTIEDYGLYRGPTLVSLASRTSLFHDYSDLDEVSFNDFLRRHLGYVLFSPDGTIFADVSSYLVQSIEQKINLRDSTTGQLLSTLDGYNSTIHGKFVSFSPDGTTLVSFGSTSFDNIYRFDNIICLWSVKTGELLRTIEGFGLFSPDGTTLVSFGSEGIGVQNSTKHTSTIRFWDVTTGEHRHTIEGHIGIGSISFNPDGTLLASAGGDGDYNIYLWNTRTSQLLHTLEGHTENVNSVAFSPDGEILASHSTDNTLRLWSPTGEHIRTIEGDKRSWFGGMAFSPDGNLLAATSKNEINLWSPTGEHIRTIVEGHEYSVLSVSFHPDGTMLASAGSHGDINLWDVTTGKHIRTIEGDTDNWWLGWGGMAFSPDGTMLAAGVLHDNTFRLWSPSTGQLLHTLEGHWSSYAGGGDVAFSPDGTLLAGTSGGRIYFWDAATGSKRIAYPLELGKTSDVVSVLFTPDGTSLASVGDEGILLLWDTLNIHGYKPRRMNFQKKNGEVNLSPSSVISPDIGDQLTLSLNIAGGQNIIGYRATVHFDETALRYVSSSHNRQPGHYISRSPYHWSVDNTVTFEARRIAGTETIGGGTLATITFEGVAVKESTVHLLGVLLDDSSGESSIPKVENTVITIDDHGDTRTDATPLPLGGSLSGEIQAVGDVDYFTVEIPEDGELTVWTTGDTDTSGELLEIIGSATSLVEDGDSGQAKNFQIQHDVSPIVFKGDMCPRTYYVKVTGVDIGSYTIHANLTSTCYVPKVHVIWCYPNNVAPDVWVNAKRKVNIEKVVDIMEDVSDFYSKQVYIFTKEDVDFKIDYGPNSSLPHKIMFDLPEKDLSEKDFNWIYDKIADKWPHIKAYTNKDFYIAIIQSQNRSVDGPRGLLDDIVDGKANLYKRFAAVATGNVGWGIGGLTVHEEANTKDDIAQVVAHELGHLFGLSHVYKGDNIMAHDRKDPLTANFLTEDQAKWISAHAAFGCLLPSTSKTVPAIPTSLYQPSWVTSPQLIGDSKTYHIGLRDQDEIYMIQLAVGVGKDQASAISDIEFIKMSYESGPTVVLEILEEVLKIDSNFFNSNDTVVLDIRILDKRGDVTRSVFNLSNILRRVQRYQLADVDGDGKVDTHDVDIIEEILDGNKTFEVGGINAKADLNGDNKVTTEDKRMVEEAIMERYQLADVDGNGKVDTHDVDIIEEILDGKEPFKVGIINAEADLNGDDEVTAEDKRIVEEAIRHLGAAPAPASIQVSLPRQETTLLPNYPNPFNPETWIPYQLATPADVSITIYAADGKLVRSLDLGHQSVGMYQHRNRAAHWDGKNDIGESVASGVYFYTFKAGDFSATRKMLILK